MDRHHAHVFVSDAESTDAAERDGRLRIVRPAAAPDTDAAAGTPVGWRGRKLTYWQQVWETVWVAFVLAAAIALFMAGLGYPR